MDHLAILEHRPRKSDVPHDIRRSHPVERTPARRSGSYAWQPQLTTATDSQGTSGDHEQPELSAPAKQASRPDARTAASRGASLRGAEVLGRRTPVWKGKSRVQKDGRRVQRRTARLKTRPTKSGRVRKNAETNGGRGRGELPSARCPDRSAMG